MHPKQKLSTLHLALIIIATLNIGALCLFVCLSLSSQELTNLNYVSVVSTFSVAILTILYVFTTDNQMKVMKSQLDEMQHEHLLKERPILLINKPKIRIKKPAFFYTPPIDSFSFQSLYVFEASLVNASDDPAIIARISVSIVVPHNEGKHSFHTVPEKLNFVSSKSGATSVSFHFVDDTEGYLFSALREKRNISIQSVVCYQNTTGAYFAIKNVYRLNLNILTSSDVVDLQKGQQNSERKSIVEIIANWHTTMIQAPVKYIEVISKLRRLLKQNDQRSEYKKVFQETKDEIDSSLISKDDIVCPLYEDSESFEFSPITHEEYLDYLKESMGVEEMLLSCKHAPSISASAKK